MRSRLSLLALLASFLVLFACEGGGPPGARSGGEEVGQDEQPSGSAPSGEAPPSEPGAAPTSADPACEALAPLAQQQGDVVGWLASAPISPANSEGFKEPAATLLQDFQRAFEQLLEAGPGTSTVNAFASLGYELIAFRHETGQSFVVLQERAPRTGGGTFLVNVHPARDLWLEAPHADSDAGTLRQAASQLVRLGARALLITGSHRCANSQQTSCDGVSVQCGGALRVSDAAHYDRNYFTAAHRALRAVHPQGLAVSVHGMESAGAEAAVVSDGTRKDDPGSVSVRLRDGLNARLGSSTARAFSCNDPADAGKYRPLCGVTNVQGRIDNGAPEACTSPSPASQQRFVHLEQSPALRQGDAAEYAAEALAEVVPCSLGGAGIGCGGTAVACR